MMHRIILTGGMLLALAACKPGTTGGSSRSASGLSTDEVASIISDTKTRLEQRTYRNAGFAIKPCGDFFSVGNPQIVDSAIEASSGKAKISAPITLRQPFASASLLAQECFRAENRLWEIGQPVTLSFEVDLERWQSGWRLAQHQSSGLN